MYATGGTLLEACVLGYLARGETYGYALTQSMQGALGVSESTLYPVLRRLQKEQLLMTRDEAYDGRNRRYYRLTDAGLETLSLLRADWARYRGLMDGLIGGEDRL